jgi:hypothetical protein
MKKLERIKETDGFSLSFGLVKIGQKAKPIETDDLN